MKKKNSENLQINETSTWSERHKHSDEKLVINNYVFNEKQISLLKKLNLLKLVFILDGHGVYAGLSKFSYYEFDLEYGSILILNSEGFIYRCEGNSFTFDDNKILIKKELCDIEEKDVYHISYCINYELRNYIGYYDDVFPEEKKKKDKNKNKDTD